MIDASPLVLVLVLGCVIAVPMLLRHRRAQAPDGLRVLGRTALSKQAVIAVVAVGERRLLVGAGEQGVSLLADLDAGPGSVPAPSAADTPAATTPGTTMGPDRTDAAGPVQSLRRATGTEVLAASDGEGAVDDHGPGNGLVDRLRARTVRTPTPGRPFHGSLLR